MTAKQCNPYDVEYKHNNQRSISFSCFPESDSEVQLEELLAFWTGAAKIPPGGFDNRLTVAFFTQEAGVDRLPSASTCGLMLCLPRGCTDGDRFKDRMVFILKNTHGFGRV